MRRIRFIVQKEFLQIFRNKGMLPIIFVMPVIQLIVLTSAATFELKHVRFNVVDLDQSSSSRLLINKFTASGYFELVSTGFSSVEETPELEKGRAGMVLRIPRRFERDLVNGGKTSLQLIINAEDGNRAGLTQSYASGIVRSFREELIAGMTASPVVMPIAIESLFWFNPELRYDHYMLPGILVVLVTMIGVFLSGMNIVREREIGTIEQLNVTPIRKHEFMIGKLLPFGIIGIFELTFGLIIGRVLFDLPVIGGLTTIFLCAVIYLFVVLSFGLFLSTITDTQQQAMFIAWFFVVIFMLMGGIFTPIESMPDWAQHTAYVNPVAQFIHIMRAVLLKGATLADLKKEITLLCVYAVVLMTLAVNRYKKYTT